MIAYDLPETVEVGGKSYPIRTDYRAALDILTALSDPELTEADRVIVLMGIFYPEGAPENTEKAVEECMRFLGGGQESREWHGPRLVDWEKDFPWIVSPINRMLGRDIRGEKMHWWTFLSLYFEIGDCTFSQIVRIRDSKARGKSLDKAEREWLRRNGDLVRIEQKTTAEEDALLAAWTGGNKNAD